MPRLRIVAANARYTAPSLWDAPAVVPAPAEAVAVDAPVPLPDAPLSLAAARAARAAAKATAAASHAKPTRHVASAVPAEPSVPKAAPWPAPDRAALVWGTWPAPDARLAVVGDPERRVWAFMGAMECGVERPGVELVLWSERANRLASRAWVDAPRVRYLDISQAEQTAEAKAAKVAKRKRG